MNTIRKGYHIRQAIAEIWNHHRKYVVGKRVRVGKTYSAITARDGRAHEGPFEALAYENGNLLVGTPDRRLFFVLDEDVVDVNGSIYIENLPNKLRFKKDLLDVISNADTNDECCKRLKLASSVKWMCPLTAEYAMLILHWHRSALEEESSGYNSFDPSMSLDDYFKALQRCLMMSDWHYTEEGAKEHLLQEMRHVRSYFAEKEAPWKAAIDIGYCCG